MKTFIFNKLSFISALILFSAINIFPQTQVFIDNLNTNTSKWVLSGSWGLTTSSSHSSAKSLTDSPGGNYANTESTSAASINIDLSGYLGAEFNFWAKYNLENAFDFVYVEISKDGGNKLF